MPVDALNTRARTHARTRTRGDKEIIDDGSLDNKYFTPTFLAAPPILYFLCWGYQHPFL